MLVLTGDDGAVEPSAQTVYLCLQHAPVRELEEADTFGSRAGQHWTKWSQQAAQHERRQGLAALWSTVERLRESLVEPTG